MELVLNGIYVACTVFITVIAFKSLKNNNKTQKLLLRPFISISFECSQNGGAFILKIKNTGKSTAQNISIIVSDEYIKNISSLKKLEEHLLFLKNMNLILMPDQEEILLLGTHKNFEVLSNKKMLLKTVYTDLSNDLYGEEHKIDINSFSHFLSIPNDTEKIIHELNEINKTLKSSN